ncbi:hypothetical protein NHQ30_011215 [Ciborinia camelliae]|nr:hypothetical protein NHQ30_011215 [Ciborinia camelliae]
MARTDGRLVTACMDKFDEGIFASRKVSSHDHPCPRVALRVNEKERGEAQLEERFQDHIIHVTVLIPSPESVIPHNGGVSIPNIDGSLDTAELWRKSNAGVSIPNADGTSDAAELWKKRGNGAVEIPNADGSSDAAELWKKRGNGAVGIPNADGGEDVAELW